MILCALPLLLVLVPEPTRIRDWVELVVEMELSGDAPKHGETAFRVAVASADASQKFVLRLFYGADGEKPVGWVEISRQSRVIGVDEHGALSVAQDSSQFDKALDAIVECWWKGNVRCLAESDFFSIGENNLARFALAMSGIPIEKSPVECAKSHPSFLLLDIPSGNIFSICLNEENVIHAIEPIGETLGNPAEAEIPSFQEADQFFPYLAGVFHRRDFELARGMMTEELAEQYPPERLERILNYWEPSTGGIVSFEKVDLTQAKGRFREYRVLIRYANGRTTAVSATLRQASDGCLKLHGGGIIPIDPDDYQE